MNDRRGRRRPRPRADHAPVAADGSTMTAAEFEAALDELVANPPDAVPLPGRIPELYRRASFELAGPTRTGSAPFTRDDARRALAAAADSLALPRAGSHGADSVDGLQPDPADVGAFLRALEAEGLACPSGGGFLLDREGVPF